MSNTPSPFVKVVPSAEPDLRGVYIDLFYRAERKDPTLNSGEFNGGNIVYTHAARRNAVIEDCRKRAPFVLARYIRLRAWAAEENRRRLAAMSDEEARTILCAQRSRSLEWYEDLPHGITMQLACNKTGVQIFYSYWQGRIQRTEHYTPHAKKPRKSRITARKL